MINTGTCNVPGNDALDWSKALKSAVTDNTAANAKGSQLLRVTSGLPVMTNQMNKTPVSPSDTCTVLGKTGVVVRA
ncbi:hypothetical protein GCM10022249_23470 [Enteractinococcus coprophilus]